jgi:hypothetical protein
VTPKNDRARKGIWHNEQSPMFFVNCEFSRVRDTGEPKYGLFFFEVLFWEAPLSGSFRIGQFSKLSWGV